MKARPKILIVGDNSDGEALLVRQFKKAELHEYVKTIRDGRMALEFLRDAEGELSAVFLDLHLPKVSGLRLLRVIRSNEHTRELPVIIMTSSNSSEEIEKCHKLGVSSYVQKPLTFSNFAKAVADSFHERCQAKGSSRE